MEDKKRKFLNIIMNLLDAYVNWKFIAIDNSGNPTPQLNLWYRMLEHIDIDVLEYVVFDYMKDNIYPPSSPASIIDHYKKLYLSIYSVDENTKFELAREIYKDQRQGDYSVERTCKILDIKGEYITSKAFESVKGRFTPNASVDDIEIWAKKEFIEKYKELNKIDIERKIKHGGLSIEVKNNTLLIGQGENKHD